MVSFSRTLSVLQILFISNNVFESKCYYGDTCSYQRPGQNLCESPYQDVDCSNQIISAHGQGSCLMKYMNRSSAECSASGFTGDDGEPDVYGTVNMLPFAWIDNKIRFPSFNITFNNIQWKRLRMKFVKGRDIVQICREFELSEDIDASSVLSFDCLWGNGSTAGKFYKFEYMLTNKFNKDYVYSYLLQVPDESFFDNNPKMYRVFMIVDQTSLPVIGLKLQVPYFDISNLSVSLYYKEEATDIPKLLKYWPISLNSEEKGTFVTVEPYETDNSLGYYYFNATYCTTDYCETSTSPVLNKSGFKHGGQVIAALVLITVSLLGLSGYLLWMKKHKKIPDGAVRPSNVLFVYDPSYKSFVDMIYNFKAFLENNCYVDPKVDLIEIPKVNSKNPRQWYRTAFEDANYVLVFASPDESTEKSIHEDNVYPGLYSYALNLLIEYMSNKQKYRLKFSVASVKLPGCSWDTVHPELKPLIGIRREFSLPEKLPQFFKFMNIPPIRNGSTKLISALQEGRSSPRHSIELQLDPKLPQEEELVDLPCTVKGPLTVAGAQLLLDGCPTHRDEDYDDDDDDDNFSRSSSILALNM